MTRIAAFQRESTGMRKLKALVESALSSPSFKTDDIPQALLLKDLLLTQRAVLSAMLFAAEEQSNACGVLMTSAAGSTRVPARPIPERDLWFENVWKKNRERQQGVNR